MVPDPTPMEIKPCDESYFTGTPELEAIAKKLININAFFCIPRTNPVDNFRIQGKIGTVGYRYLKVEFSRCTSLPSCASAADVDAALATTSIVFAYGDSFIDINNFENPIQFSQGGLYDHLSTPYWREKFINLTPLKLDSDEGYLTAGTKHYTGYTVNIGETVFDIPLTTPPNEQVRFTFYIRLSTQQTQVQRSYKKIQDVLAETTGISSTLALIFLIILKPYVKLKKSEEMINQILLVHKEKKSEVTFWDYVKAKFGNKKAKAKMERFKKQEAAIERRTDILHLVQNMFNIERIMYLTYSEDQKILINNVVPHSNDPEEIEFKHQFEEEISPQVIRALSNISEKPNKDPVDIALLKHYHAQKVKLLDMEKSGPMLLNDTSSLPNSPSNLQFATTQMNLSPSKFGRPTKILPFPSGTVLMDSKVGEIDGSEIELK